MPDSSPSPSPSPSILDEAAAIISGPRQQAYGDARADFTDVAKLWSVILGHEITCQQALLCMIALKLRRESHRASHDNRLDMIGYAALLEQVETDVAASHRPPQSLVAAYDSAFDHEPFTQLMSSRQSPAPSSLAGPLAPVTAEAARALFAQMRSELDRVAP